MVRWRLEAKPFIGSQLAARLFVTYSTRPTKFINLAKEQSISVSKVLKPTGELVDELFAHQQSFFPLQSIFA